MKAKRIMSLLLTVAMIVAYSATVFAAPAGYVQTATTALNGVDSEELATGSALPNSDEIYADATVTPLTDDEFSSIYGSAPSEWGAPEGTSAYLVKLSMKKLGTLTQNMKVVSGRPAYSGLKIVKIEAQFKYGDGVSFATDYKSDFSGINTDLPNSDCATASANMETYYQFTYQNAGANTAYPSTNGTYADAGIDNVITLVFFAKPGAVVTLNKLSVGYANYMNGTPGGVASIAVWHPATVTLGTPASNVQATMGDDGIITVTGDSALAGKDILVHDAALPQDAKLKTTSRFVVRQKSNSKTREYNIFEALNVEGLSGSISSKTIKFGIVSNSDLDATDFVFSFTGIN